jgi:hypothetical protein
MIKPIVAAGMFILIAVSAADASNAPPWSPYAIMTPDFPTAPAAAANFGVSSENGMRENRAA